jgi:ATP-dependent Clp protease ATP-binding subunit ClpA
MTGGMGFVQPKDRPASDLDEKVERTAIEAARRKFSPEFMNRLDKVVVFHPLQRTQLEEVLEIELGQVQQRVLETARGQFLFKVTPAAREFLLQEGTDQRYGARHLKRAIERHIVYPLANLLATEQVRLGDLIKIDWDGEHKQLTFVRESEGALVENPPQHATAKAAPPTEAQDGRPLDLPTEAVAEERKMRAATPAAGPGPSSSGRKKAER